jgi:hypothetical protein
LHKTMRFAASSAAFIALIVQTPLQAGSDPSGFCARLAENAGIERTQTIDGETTWSANALNFGQRVLFGGTAATSVNVDPLQPATVEDYKRAATMCAAEGKGAICRLIGPINFEFSWKGIKTSTPVLTGEAATVVVEGTRATCRSSMQALGSDHP